MDRLAVPHSKKMYGAVRIIFIAVLIAGVLHATTYERILKVEGQSNSEEVGASVSSAGDLNGDGYDDIIIGVPGLNAGNGAVYVYYGGPLFDSIPDVVINGAYHERLGSSVSAAGDVNGDGYDDIIVGSPWAEDAGPEFGIAHIYYGGVSMDTIPDVTMRVVNSDDQFGYSVSSAGDVNGDGYDDVIVGAPHNDFGGEYDAGAAYIFYGGPSMDSIPDVTMGIDTASMEFGYAVSGAGDLNGDGHDDVIVCVKGYNFGGLTSSGAVFVFYGGNSMDSIADLRVGGEQAWEAFGQSLSGAGDLNGDGYDDFIVGAYGYDYNGVTNVGAAYIYFGGASVDSIWDVKIVGNEYRGRLGGSVSGGGDVNKDGYDDVIVGAHLTDLGNRQNVGAVYVFYGGDSMDSIYDFRINGENAGDEFGKCVSNAGDVNKDGYDDVIVGTNWYANGGSSNAGAAYLYDFFMFKDITPNGGETWNVGANETITWKGKDTADLYISTDGGHTWDRIAYRLTPPEDTNFNTYTFQVPHIPTRYAKVAVTYSSVTPDYSHLAILSDSFFTIKSTVNLLKFEAKNSDDNNSVNLTWQTDPGLDVLSGYNLYRIKTNGTKERINTDLIRATTYKDTKSAEVTGYELGAVNGLGEEYRIGEVEFYTLKKPLEVLPSVTDSRLSILLDVPEYHSDNGDNNEVNIKVVNMNGRVIKNIYKGSMNSGVHRLNIDLSDVPAGTYTCVVEINGELKRRAFFQKIN